MLLEITKNTLKKAIDTSKPVLFAPTLPIAKAFWEVAAKELGAEHRQEHEHTTHVFGICEAHRYDSFSLHTPAIGAPIITFLLQPILELGVKEVLLLSICGGIRSECNKTISIGDIICPSAAICDEGTSPHYGAKELITLADPSLQEKILKFVKNNYQVHEGAIWTTDAIYKETPERVRKYAQKGAIGVDMELSAAMHLCNLYGAKLGAIFAVSDVTGDDFAVGLHEHSFQQALSYAAQILCTYLKS
ncbi:MAG: hypothetical protein IT292_10905 [Deltaproteobacteria bacterium]|nr:hypothetical protein [Deltaproteobacteria bacterium]